MENLANNFYLGRISPLSNAPVPQAVTINPATTKAREETDKVRKTPASGMPPYRFHPWA
jgi:hypothetical protein